MLIIIYACHCAEYVLNMNTICGFSDMLSTNPVGAPTFQFEVPTGTVREAVLYPVFPQARTAPRLYIVSFTDRA